MNNPIPSTTDPAYQGVPPGVDPYAAPKPAESWWTTRGSDLFTPLDYVKMIGIYGAIGLTLWGAIKFTHGLASHSGDV